jgi:hypothetical protein
MRRPFLALVVTLYVANPATAHHSPAAFDLTSQITIQGKISRVDWTNPHVYIYVDTVTPAGAPAHWIIETDPTPILTRSGWRRDLMRVGATVTVRANPAKNTQRNHALLVSLGLGNGLVLVPRAPAAGGAARAASVAGVWNALRGFSQRRFGILKPTAKGLAAMKSYSEALNPTAKCTPWPTPMLTTLPYLNEIEVRGDRVFIRSEFFSVDRTVYMDGRSHPREGARTTEGHSVGRWEGDVLVVDTALFADHRGGSSLGSGSPSTGLASGSQKRVVERYRLSDDRTRLLVDLVVEDPEYLAEPFTVGTEWDYAPQQRLLRFGCEPEQAQRFTVQ